MMTDSKDEASPFDAAPSAASSVGWRQSNFLFNRRSRAVAEPGFNPRGHGKRRIDVGPICYWISSKNAGYLVKLSVFGAPGFQEKMAGSSFLSSGIPGALRRRFPFQPSIFGVDDKNVGLARSAGSPGKDESWGEAEGFFNQRAQLQMLFQKGIGRKIPSPPNAPVPIPSGRN